jgi:hypothetical protein
MTIWKYQLKMTDEQIVEMPSDGYPLCVQVQGGVPCLWAMVNPLSAPAPKTIEIFGTGHTMPRSNRIYVGTFQTNGGRLVWHVFERK